MEKQCVLCGGYYEALRSTQKYCPQCKGVARGRQKILAQRAARARRFDKDTQKLYSRECRNCGKLFESPDKSAVFCSTDCLHNYKIDHTSCAICGKPMRGSGSECYIRGQQWYCSPECKSAARDIKRVHSIPTSTCVVCGKKYKGWGKFCSDVCQAEDKRRSMYIPDVIQRRCAGCHKVFRAEHYVQVLCPDCESKGIIPSDCVANTCKGCGKTFATYRYHMVYCSTCLRQFMEEPTDHSCTIENQTGDSLCKTCIHTYNDCPYLQSSRSLLMPGCKTFMDKMLKCDKYRRMESNEQSTG